MAKAQVQGLGKFRELSVADQHIFSPVGRRLGFSRHIRGWYINSAYTRVYSSEYANLQLAWNFIDDEVDCYVSPVGVPPRQGLSLENFSVEPASAGVSELSKSIKARVEYFSRALEMLGRINFEKSIAEMGVSSFSTIQLTQDYSDLSDTMWSSPLCGGTSAANFYDIVSRWSTDVGLTDKKFQHGGVYAVPHRLYVICFYSPHLHIYVSYSIDVCTPRVSIRFPGFSASSGFSPSELLSWRGVTQPLPNDNTRSLSGYLYRQNDPIQRHLEDIIDGRLSIREIAKERQDVIRNRLRTQLQEKGLI